MTEIGATRQESPRGGVARRAFALGLAALLAACQVVPKAPPKPVEAPPDTAPPSQLPTDIARHRIALLVPLTGTNAGVGEAIANAATMAVLDTGGKTIRVTSYDTAGGAAAAVQKALADGNRLILGPLLAEDVRAVAPIARAANVPVLSFSNDVSVAGNGTYVLGFVPTQSVERIVSYARSKGASNFAGLVPEGTYGQRSASALLRAVEAAGGKIVAMQSYDRTQPAMNAAVAKLAGSGPVDAILIADSGRVALQLVPMLRKRGSTANPRILGTELWNTEPTLARSPMMHGAWFASVPDSYYNQLAGKYRTRYAKPPYRLASLGYDAVLLATRVAENWKVGSAFPVKQLEDPGGFSGVDGAFRLGRSGIAERTLEVQQIGANGFSVISPAASSFGK